MNIIKIIVKNLFLQFIPYDSYGKKDNRNKIIAKILKDYKSNKITTILSRKVELNLLNVKEICEAFVLTLRKKIKSGNYLIKAKIYKYFKFN